MSLDHETVQSLRGQFPALQKQVAGRPAVFFDGPAGTQVPTQVMEAITRYLTDHNANHGGLFATSIESDRLLDEAHKAAADLLGTRDHDTVFFGANMTTLTAPSINGKSLGTMAGATIKVKASEMTSRMRCGIMRSPNAGATAIAAPTRRKTRKYALT